MPGMASGLNANNSTIVAAFKTALFHQGLIVLLILALLLAAWRVLRLVELERATARRAAMSAVGGAEESVVPLPTPPATTIQAEPRARQFLRIAFGCVWIFDGILQAQVQMPLGMTQDVIQPTAAASPHWVQSVANAGATIWSFHPVTAAAAAVWIQVGVGLFLLVAPRGRWSRLAGLASVAWGLVVWVFGEAFGGIFAPGLTWLFGAPGAVLFYVVAGALVALPERAFVTPRLGRIVLSLMGVFFCGMAVLQAWPGRGFWQGRFAHPVAGSHLGTLAGMAASMASTPQPHFLSAAVSSFASFDEAHGFAVNLFVVAALAVIGVALMSRRPAVLRAALFAAAVLCIADWVLVEDFGFFGGVGTDPNSMVPMLFVLLGGYLAVVRAPLGAVAVEPAVASQTPARRWNWKEADPGYLLRVLAAVGAMAVVFIGAIPMAFASASNRADPILTVATDGSPDTVDFPAPNFQLTDQHGTSLSLRSLRGKDVVVTFLDPVCTSDCPLIAQEMKAADQMLGASSRHVEFVAVDANPLYRQRAYLVAFDQQEAMAQLSNWRYVTGSAAALRRVWNNYGVQDAYSPGGAMVAHSDLSYVINKAGMVRTVLNSDPGAGTEATRSSFSATLVNAIDALGNK